MWYPQLLLGLAASASAIDAYFHLGTICDGPWARCEGLNPGKCCFATGSNSVAYRGIPTQWSITSWTWLETNCVNLGTQGKNRGQNFICMSSTNGNYRSTDYYFDGKKRAVTRGEKPCQRVTTLGLGDGTEYDLRGLDDAAFNEM